MKHFYRTLLMSVIAIALSFSAKADINVTLKVDDATRLTGYIQYTDASYNYVQTDLDLTQFIGDGGSFTIPASYGYIYLNATEGNTITSAMNETTGQAAGTGSQVYFYLYGDAALSVTSADLESTRTASCTVNVDDASKVSLTYGTGSSIALENGTNIVKFNPNNESPFQISHANYGETLYGVVHNGASVTDSYGRYQVSVADGDIIDIMANFPDQPSTINFTYGENENEVFGCIIVEVDGKIVNNFDGRTLTVKLGQKVKLIGDPNLFNYNYSIYVNGESQYFYDYYEFTVTKTEYTIAVNATKYATFNIFVTVNNPENVTVYAGNSNYSEPLISGVSAAVALTSSANYINLMPSTDCYISSITVNGTEYSSNYGSSSVTVRNLNENDQVVVTTGKISRDKSATIWVDDLTAAMYGYSVQRYSDRQTVELISGETVTVNFDDSDNPYYLSFYQPTVCEVFTNGVLTEPQYEGSTSYYVTLVDGDAIKVYLAAAPDKYAVSITSTINNAIATVSTDAQPFGNWAQGFTALNGTIVSLTLNEGVSASVIAGGNEIIADENGKYNVTISADTEIVIDEQSGIENITANTENGNVYNLQGIIVLKNANAEQINALPAGIYIINGKKFIR